jgi:L-lysine 2,3-aminomutase
VILSDGDPLTLNDRRLADGFTGLVAMPDVRHIRLHTRLPIVLPERIVDVFLDAWSAVRCRESWSCTSITRARSTTARPGGRCRPH